MKERLADLLRAEIVNGNLSPGDRVVEGMWAAKYEVAQGSIREAINILGQEGFITKAPGRSARVIDLSKNDVVQLYELRGAIEGLAAKCAAVTGKDLSRLQDAVDGMRVAVIRKQPEEMLDCDLRFHLELCDLSGNTHLQEHARRILLPFFAFVRMRVTTRNHAIAAWEKDLETHQRIVMLVGDGEGEVAEEYVRRAMVRFAEAASQNWGKTE